MSRPLGIHPALVRTVRVARVSVRAAMEPDDMERAARLLRAQWPKQCGCGRAYGEGWHLPSPPISWLGLPRRYQRTDEASTNEARDCLCGSTLEVMVAIHDVDEVEG